MSAALDLALDDVIQKEIGGEGKRGKGSKAGKGSAGAGQGPKTKPSWRVWSGKNQLRAKLWAGKGVQTKTSGAVQKDASGNKLDMTLEEVISTKARDRPSKTAASSTASRISSIVDRPLTAQKKVLLQRASRKQKGASKGTPKAKAKLARYATTAESQSWGWEGGNKTNSQKAGAKERYVTKAYGKNEGYSAGKQWNGGGGQSWAGKTKEKDDGWKSNWDNQWSSKQDDSKWQGGKSGKAPNKTWERNSWQDKADWNSKKWAPTSSWKNEESSWKNDSAPSWQKNKWDSWEDKAPKKDAAWKQWWDKHNEESKWRSGQLRDRRPAVDRDDEVVEIEEDDVDIPEPSNKSGWPRAGGRDGYGRLARADEVPPRRRQARQLARNISPRAAVLALMDRGRERDARPVRGRYQLAESAQVQPATRGYPSQGQKRPQRPRQEEQPPERSKRVRVGNIPKDLDPRDIKDAFEEETGKIHSCQTDRSRGVAFLTYRSEDAARKAVDTFNRGELNGKIIDVTLVD